jgi:hypothetical protein
MTIRCQVNWQLGVNFGVSFGAKKLLGIAAVSGRSWTTRLSEFRVDAVPELASKSMIAADHAPQVFRLILVMANLVRGLGVIAQLKK